MLYFVWYDDNQKKLVADKIQEAIAAYVNRFATRPSLVLVNAVSSMSGRPVGLATGPRRAGRFPRGRRRSGKGATDDVCR